jgi:hypothetical protein
MNSACPQCGVVYSVTPKDFGRRIACKRCRTALIVEETGLRVDPDFVGQPTAGGFTAEATVGEEVPPQRAAGTALSLPPMLTKLGRLDAATWLFGAGAVLAIVFLFFPLIDKAKVSRRNAAIQMGDLDESKKDRALTDKGDKASDKEKEARQKERDEWKKDRAVLVDEARETEYAAARAGYFNRYGAMFSFLLLTIGALGFVIQPEPGLRRTLGTIVLSAEMIAAFIAVAIGGAGEGVVAPRVAP